MRLRSGAICFTAIICICFINSALAYPQLPPRLQIPGALLLEQPKPLRARTRVSQQQPQLLQEVRPVIEDIEDAPSPLRFSNPIQQASPIQQLIEVEPETDKQQNVQFRSERPVTAQRQIQYSQPIPQQRPVVRQELKQQQSFIPVAEIPHLRRPPPQQQQQQRPIARPVPRPAPQYLDDEGHRTRKPPVQILRKYRTDNADGSITWGYENEDGSFKEETIGIDCITRGKYGYIDPDGVKREYTYETGGTCEEPEEELEDLPPGKQPVVQKGKKTYKLPAPQYIN